METQKVKSEIELRYEAALEAFVDKLRPDPNVVAVIVYGSMSRNEVWEKSDIDVQLLVREVKLSTTSFCIDEDGIILNVDVGKVFEFKRMLERSQGGLWHYSLYANMRVEYCTDDSLKESLLEAGKMGESDRVLTFFSMAAWLIGNVEKIEKWLTAKNDLLYAQFFILKAADIYASMRLVLDKKLPHRDAVPKLMGYAPELIKPVYEKPMSGLMNREEIEEAIEFFRQFLTDNLELLKKPVEEYMSDGAVRNVTTLVKHFNLGSHGIDCIFEFLADNGVVCRVTETAKITPRSRKTVEEVAYIYTEGN